MEFRTLLLLSLASIAFVSAQVSDYSQCGGATYTGVKVCGAKSVCRCRNYYWWECVPSSAVIPQAGEGCPTSSNQPVQQNQPIQQNQPVQQNRPGTSPPSTQSTPAPAVNGGKLASSTHYTEDVQGSCGCGNGAYAPWEVNRSDGYWTVAGTQNLFGGTGSWCGSGCGKCFQITSTGKAAAPGRGSDGPGTSILAILTNLCPIGGEWCSVPNQHNYQYHFDVFGNPPGWDNPSVYFTEVACPYSLANDYKTCRCQNGVDTQSGVSFS